MSTSSAPSSISTARAAPHQLTDQERRFTLFGVLLGMLLAALDQTIVSTAGPAIQRDLMMPASLYAWITTSYMLSSTVLVPIYGKLSDLYGRKPLLLVGIGIFLLGSVLCAMSRTSLQLILARGVQGAGSAALFTIALAVIADIFPPAVRGRYTGLFGAVWGLSSVVGPLAGGFLTDHLSWHWVFLVNLPVGAVAVAFIVLRMPRLRRPGAEARIDVAGAVTLALAVVPLLLALSFGAGGGAGGGALAGGAPHTAWTSAPVIGLFALSAVATALFVFIEWRAESPLLDLGLFDSRTFAVGNAAVFVIGAVFFAGIVFLPLFMTNVVGVSATGSGMTLMPLTLALVAGNVGAGQAVTRLGRYRPLMLGSLLVLFAAFLVMGLTLDVGATQTSVILKMILVGIGLGPSIPLYTLAIQNAVPQSQTGVATATVTFFRQIGATVGVAIMGTVYASSLGRTLAARADAGTPGALRGAIAGATAHVYLVGAGLVVVALLLTALMPALPLRKSNA